MDVISEHLDQTSSPKAKSTIRGLVDDLHIAFGFHPREGVLHLLEAFGRMGLPFRDLAHDPERRAGAVGSGGIAGESLVREVGIVLERAGRFDDVDALWSIALGQLAAPDRRVERAGEVDPRELLLLIIGGEARREQMPTCRSARVP